METNAGCNITVQNEGVLNMTKIIEVETCGLCPYRAYPDMECTRTMNEIKDMQKINDDCPLEDVEDFC